MRAGAKAREGLMSSWSTVASRVLKRVIRGSACRARRRFFHPFGPVTLYDGCAEEILKGMAGLHAMRSLWLSSILVVPDGLPVSQRNPAEED